MGATGSLLRKMEILNGIDRKSTDYHKRNRAKTGLNRKYIKEIDTLIYGQQGTFFDNTPTKKEWQNYNPKKILRKLHVVHPGQMLVNPDRQHKKELMHTLGTKNGKTYRRVIRRVKRDEA